MCFYVCYMFPCALLCVLSSLAFILIGKRERVALPCLSSWCLAIVIVLWLFLKGPWFGLLQVIQMPWLVLQRVIQVFPDHPRLLFSAFQLKMKAS